MNSNFVADMLKASLQKQLLLGHLSVSTVNIDNGLVETLRSIHQSWFKDSFGSCEVIVALGVIVVEI